MKFFHVYNEDLFAGLEKNSLLNKDTAFKTQNVFSVPTHLLFNNIAARGGKLYNILREGKFPYYVDRIAGGVTYFPYAFDKSLLEDYADMLGDWFLGVQHHESGCIRRKVDWPRLIQVTGGCKGPYDADELHRLLLRPYAVTADGTMLEALVQDSSAFYATQKYAETWQEFHDEMRDMYRRRLEDTAGHILTCDSDYIATKLQDEMGVHSFMPEVGGCVHLMRMQAAVVRGMARARKKTWGTYYECWRLVEGVGHTMPCYHVDEINEWYLTQETHKDDFTTYGKNGGSSRLLQNRIYHYALMAGADYFSEEWGTNCSYDDMQTYSLSEYGLVKKNFIHTALGLQGVKSRNPFAVVLPKEYSCIYLGDIRRLAIGEHPDQYLESPITPAERDWFGHMQDVLKLIFARPGTIYGNEGQTITNGRFGDVFDVIYEDAPSEAMDRYEYLIDATPEGRFAKAAVGRKVLESGDLWQLEADLNRLIPEIMPCYVDDLCWLVSDDAAGNRYLSVFNNEGNERSLEHGDTLLPEADRTVTVTFRETVDLQIVTASVNTAPVEVQKADDRTFRVKVPAAAFVIFRY